MPCDCSRAMPLIRPHSVNCLLVFTIHFHSKRYIYPTYIPHHLKSLHSQVSKFRLQSFEISLFAYFLFFPLSWESFTIMGFRFPSVVLAKQLIQRPFSNSKDVPKGYFAVYVGDETKMKRFVIPVSYLNQPSIQKLLSQAEEEFGFDHPMGALTIPCTEDVFIDLVSRLNV